MPYRNDLKIGTALVSACTDMLSPNNLGIIAFSSRTIKVLMNLVGWMQESRREQAVAWKQGVTIEPEHTVKTILESRQHLSIYDQISLLSDGLIDATVVDGKIVTFHSIERLEEVVQKTLTLTMNTKKETP